MQKLASALITIGTLILVIGLGFLLLIFYPIIMEELGYDFAHLNDTTSKSNTLIKTPQITPVDVQFGIIIPKIKANSKVIAQVDPYNPKVYQYALTKGVAQAKGTAFPYEEGNMFLFSHSSVNFYEAQHYNSIFYLLGKLEKGDIIDIYYAGKKYTYAVTGKTIVSPEDVSFLQKGSKGHSLTLMTCWPAGTSLKRLLIEAVQEEQK